jgi:hypothetical protein
MNLQQLKILVLPYWGIRVSYWIPHHGLRYRYGHRRTHIGSRIVEVPEEKIVSCSFNPLSIRANYWSIGPKL